MYVILFLAPLSALLVMICRWSMIIIFLAYFICEDYHWSLSVCYPPQHPPFRVVVFA